MPNIIDLSYFQNPNVLQLPLAVSSPVANASIETPNNTEYLENLIDRVEKSVLVNAFGLTMYNELQMALNDIDNPIYDSYKKLVNGEEYDGKIWSGLNTEFSLIAFKIYEVFLSETNEFLTGVANTQGQSEKSTVVSPKYKITYASSEFISRYQGGYMPFPNVYVVNGVPFYDYFGCNDNVYISLYEYMMDKKADFNSFDIEKFKIYEQKNSFGI